MTNSTNDPDADYSPNDIGPPQRTGLNTPLTAKEREEYYDKLDEIALDDIPL